MDIFSLPTSAVDSNTGKAFKGQIFRDAVGNEDIFVTVPVALNLSAGMAARYTAYNTVAGADVAAVNKSVVGVISYDANAATVAKGVAMRQRGKVTVRVNAAAIPAGTELVAGAVAGVLEAAVAANEAPRCISLTASVAAVAPYTGFTADAWLI